MRVFLTGATGFIGSAVIPVLQQAGHQVLGMARSEAGAEALQLAGVDVHRGELADLDSLRRGAQQADAVIHCAFNHDFSQFAANCAQDRKAIEALGSALAGSERPLIVTSGTGITTNPAGLPASETDDAPPSSVVPRAATEEATAALAAQGVHTRIVRLAQIHNPERQGLVSYLIQIARRKGKLAYVGTGESRWPAAHRQDAARLYRLVLENGEAGKRYHAVTEEGVPARAIVETLGERLQLPVVSLSEQEAAEYFEWLAPFAVRDLVSTSAWTRQMLGWTPTGPGLLEDLRNLDLSKN